MDYPWLWLSSISAELYILHHFYLSIHRVFGPFGPLRFSVFRIQPTGGKVWASLTLDIIWTSYHYMIYMYIPILLVLFCTWYMHSFYIVGIGTWYWYMRCFSVSLYRPNVITKTRAIHIYPLHQHCKIHQRVILCQKLSSLYNIFPHWQTIVTVTTVYTSCEWTRPRVLTLVVKLKSRTGSSVSTFTAIMSLPRSNAASPAASHASGKESRKLGV